MAFEPPPPQPIALILAGAVENIDLDITFFLPPAISRIYLLGTKGISSEVHYIVDCARFAALCLPGGLTTRLNCPEKQADASCIGRVVKNIGYTVDSIGSPILVGMRIVPRARASRPFIFDPPPVITRPAGARDA